MDHDATASMSEIVGVATSAAERFGWSSRYVDLLITSAGAVFRANGLDERLDRLSVTAADVGYHLEVLKADRLEHGASPRTVAGYVTAWKRLAAIVRAWIEGGRPLADDDDFWNATVERLADTRVRRVNRRLPSSRDTVALTSDQSTPSRRVPMEVPVPMRDVTVTMSNGAEARLHLPIVLAEVDALAVIGEVMKIVERTTAVRRDALRQVRHDSR